MPYRKKFDEVLKGSKGTEIREYIDKVWNSLTCFADETLKDAKQRPTSKWLKGACEDILSVTKEADALTVAREVCSLFLLQEDRPKAFMDDNAHRMQIARRFRLLAPQKLVSVTHSEKKVRARWLQSSPVKHRKALAELLVQAFSSTVGGFLLIDRAREKARQDALETAREAFRTLSTEVYREEYERQLKVLRTDTTQGSTDERLDSQRSPVTH